jgi:hypothetical protein
MKKTSAKYQKYLERYAKFNILQNIPTLYRF